MTKNEVFISFSFSDIEKAEKIVNTLTGDYGISCWICTREVRGGEHYKRKIVEAIKDSKVVVLLVTQNAVVSEDIANEVGVAVKQAKTVVPFMLDDSELDGDIYYDLVRANWIDGKNPPLEERVKVLAEHLCYLLGRPVKDTSANGEEKRRVVSSMNVIAKNVFHGRDTLLEDIDKRFECGERVLFLRGMGGIGKTQIAKQYAKRYAHRYDTVIYSTYDGSIVDLVVADSPFAFSPSIVRRTMSDGTAETDADYFKRKLEALQSLTDERTLVILDNFDVERDDGLQMLTGGKYRLLITTRTKCDLARNYSTVDVGAIESMDDLKRIFTENYDGFDVDAEDPDLERLIKQVNCHTYTVELLAQHMQSSGQTAEKMLSELKRVGIQSLNEDVLSPELKTVVAYENLLKMFGIMSLGEEEKNVLMLLSLMPIDGVNPRNFRRWADLTSSRVLVELEKKSWIIRNTEGVALHPIIRDVIKHELPATVDSCGGFLYRFAEDLQNAWHFKKEDKDRYAHILKGLLAVFDQINEVTEELYLHGEHMLAFAVDPELAVKLAGRLYKYACERYGEISFKTANISFRAGWVYLYNTNLPDYIENGLKWLSISDGIFEKCELETDYERSVHVHEQVNRSIGYVERYNKYGERSDIDKAGYYAFKALERAEELFDPTHRFYVRVAGAQEQVVRVMLAEGRYAEALPYIEKAYATLKRLFSEDDSDVAFAQALKAEVLYGMGEYAEAAKCAKEGVAGHLRYFGSMNPGAVSRYDILGNCCARLGDVSGALDAYSKGVSIAEAVYSPDAEPLLTIKEKLSELQTQ